MSHTIYCGKIAKRRNSTLTPLTTDLSTSFDVLLKTPTSLHTPTFTIKATSFDYNYIKWNERYYFVTDVVSRNNEIWEISAICDVLATYKADIIGSTQFVSYSSHKSSIWLPDTRIPVLKNATVARSTGALSLFDDGFFVLSVVGQTGCDLWECTASDIQNILNKISEWSDDLLDAIVAGTYPFNPNKQVTVGGNNGFDFSTIELATESLAKLNSLTGFAGNAYSSAPSCIRSCIYVPFNSADYEGLGGKIYLGQFDTDVQTLRCK